MALVAAQLGRSANKTGDLTATSGSGSGKKFQIIAARRLTTPERMSHRQWNQSLGQACSPARQFATGAKPDLQIGADWKAAHNFSPKNDPAVMGPVGPMMY
jgi:hypothetical protein